MPGRGNSLLRHHPRFRAAPWRDPRSRKSRSPHVGAIAMSPAPWPSWLARVDRAVGAVVAGGRWLVLPIALILFVQWPLRDLVRAYSRDANDLGQWLFALYVSLAMTFAGRA